MLQSAQEVCGQEGFRSSTDPMLLLWPHLMSPHWLLRPRQILGLVVIDSEISLNPSLLQLPAPSRWPTLTNFYHMLPKGHLDVMLTTWAEWCHLADSLSETFLWVMSHQPSSPKKPQRGGSGKRWQGPSVPPGAAQGAFQGPTPRARFRRGSWGGEAGPRKEGQLTCLTSGWRMWRAQDCGRL